MSEVNHRLENRLRGKRILLVHSNDGEQMKHWHERRQVSANRLGFDMITFCMSDLYPYTIFPRLDRAWRRRDTALMEFYEVLGEKIDQCDVFIHYNGALIHPEFLSQFKQLKIYHCADDPDASNELSKPVAKAYDICAISNPACIEMYKSWGCKQVIFWPLGAFHFEEDMATIAAPLNEQRDILLSFVGSKLGVPRGRFVHRVPLLNKIPGVYRKKSFFEKIEKTFPFIEGYGSGWSKGRIDDDQVADLYSRTQVGINVHNSLGPINGRLYDLAAFGVCQICDNKSHLHHVFTEGKEIIGFDTLKESIELIRYYLAHQEEAREIGEAARSRFQRDYTTDKIWMRFVRDIGMCMRGAGQ